MPYYRTCPECGCNLDPGEVCDCCREPPKVAEKVAHKKEPSGAADVGRPRGEQNSGNSPVRPHSTSEREALQDED